jgi:hypothetical protein
VAGLALSALETTATLLGDYFVEVIVQAADVDAATDLVEAAGGVATR